MALSLEDVLLIMLHARPTTAFDLHARHQQTFGHQGAVGLGRVLAAVNRLRRTGHLVEDRAAAASTRTANRTLLTLTEAGRRRQRTRLVTVEPAATPDEIVAQGLLALEAAEPADFDEFTHRALALLRLRQGERAAVPPSAIEAARVSFDQEVLRALVVWLHQLPAQRTALQRHPA
ncbi:hypothetical protein Cme02nite_34480 [Catellatospora methionotrophica]|uniref:Uncharacterized protein n=1 Tax=Catellatospora methionotrophica TaxID=121620 RepID=A0A8J3PH91_9ACTN|nr:hypothetical protein [Catellatospora methionotrophica]GIG15116.1 hypothetical protein Cme02nite_34480 [Catellatospora methionotrophica]